MEEPYKVQGSGESSGMQDREKGVKNDDDDKVTGVQSRISIDNFASSNRVNFGTHAFQKR